MVLYCNKILVITATLEQHAIRPPNLSEGLPVAERISSHPKPQRGHPFSSKPKYVQALGLEMVGCLSQPLGFAESCRRIAEGLHGDLRRWHELWESAASP